MKGGVSFVYMLVVLGEVHDLGGVGVDGHGTGQCGHGAIVAVRHGMMTAWALTRIDKGGKEG